MTSPSDTPAAPDVGEKAAYRAFQLAGPFDARNGAGMWAIDTTTPPIRPVARCLSKDDAERIVSALASSAAETARLREERDEWKVEAARRFDRMREWMDASYHLKYAIDPDALEAAAKQIDCGGECETAWREHDTNASGCTKSETDGCPFELASDLRAFATAIRVHAGETEGVDWKARAQAAEAEKEAMRVERAQVVGWLRVLEPHLDAAICYASDLNEHPPNRAVMEVREFLASLSLK